MNTSRLQHLNLVSIIAPADCASILWAVIRTVPLDADFAVVILVHGAIDGNRLIATNLNRGRFPVEAGKAGSQLRNGHAVILLADSDLIINAEYCLESSSSTEVDRPLQSILSRRGEDPLVIILTVLTPAESVLLDSCRARGKSISLDERGREWLRDKNPKVLPDPRDLCLAAEEIAPEIVRRMAVWQ